MPVRTKEESPDIHDDMDCRPPRSDAETGVRTPEYLRKMVVVHNPKRSAKTSAKKK